ncbi:MAG: hypothetical protein V3V25_13370 [Paracoccaceae bacterium]
MASKKKNSRNFNIFVVGQNGRLMYEALIFVASLRHSDPDFAGKVFVAEPQAGPKWQNDPSIRVKAIRDLLTQEYGAEILPFESRHFGQQYPYGNKIEALFALPKDQPFVFFDTDTLVTGSLSQVPFDFDCPSASMRVEGTWPKPEIYGPGYTGIWQSLFDRFGLDFESSLDQTQPDEYWRKYLYFNAGWFYYRCPHKFGERFLEYALEIKSNPGEALAAQSLNPWLDQIALPLVIHSLGGSRQAMPSGFLDGATTCHYRTFPLLYARENDAVVNVLHEVLQPNKLKKVLKEYDPIKRMVYQARGQKVRDLFDQENLPKREQMIRNQIRKAGHWMR